MKRHKWSADNIAFGSGGVLELCSLLQMLMIFLLHVKPQFAQFSAAYLRHAYPGHQTYFLSFGGMLRCRGNPPMKSLWHAGYKTNHLKAFTEGSSLRRFMAEVFLRKGVYSGHSLA